MTFIINLVNKMGEHEGSGVPANWWDDDYFTCYISICRLSQKNGMLCIIKHLFCYYFLLLKNKTKSFPN